MSAETTISHGYPGEAYVDDSIESCKRAEHGTGSNDILFALLLEDGNLLFHFINLLLDGGLTCLNRRVNAFTETLEFLDESGHGISCILVAVWRSHLRSMGEDQINHPRAYE